MIKQTIQDIIIKKPGESKRESSEKAWLETQKIKQRSDSSEKVLSEKKDSAKNGPGCLKRISKGKIAFGLAVFFLAVILGAKMIDAFSRAVVLITLRAEKINLETIVKAGPGENYDFAAEKMEFSLEKSKSARATGAEDVNQYASGKIKIFNEFSSTSQLLVANTRFETSAGKVFRIHSSVVVPGATGKNEDLIPGSIEAIIYADKPGEEYNIGLSDFTIPGFKDSPRYEKFYARSVSPVEGGFIGKKAVIAEEDYERITAELENEITSEIMEKAVHQIPEGYIFYKNASNVSFVKKESSEPAENGGTTFVLSEIGTISAFLMPADSFSRFLAVKYLGEEFREKVKVANLGSLDFEKIDGDFENGTITFKIKGEANFEWIVDEGKLKEALTASPKNMSDVFGQTPAIKKASIVFKPSWWHFFPDNPSKIELRFSEQ
ncbi:MAG: hypothetical protein PHC85_00475 [Candidatus Pacebacteria bacterium]|nr:hypothetical protein [Candidatus Paceibacterota bacterium]